AAIESLIREKNACVGTTDAGDLAKSVGKVLRKPYRRCLIPRWRGELAGGEPLKIGSINKAEPHQPWHIEMTELRIRNVIKVGRIRQKYIDGSIGNVCQIACIAASQ